MELVVAQTPPNLPKLRVLVVEDHPGGRESLCVLIRLWGHACVSAASGEEALQSAPAYRPDVVLMDFRLTHTDGYEIACSLRKLPGLSRAVFVAMTGYGRAEDVQRSLDAGFFTHLVKPVDPGELQEMLAHFAAARADQR
jgi:CheY-like chemotaxis protein